MFSFIEYKRVLTRSQHLLQRCAPKVHQTIKFLQACHFCSHDIVWTSVFWHQHYLSLVNMNQSHASWSSFFSISRTVLKNSFIELYWTHRTPTPWGAVLQLCLLLCRPRFSTHGWCAGRRWGTKWQNLTWIRLVFAQFCSRFISFCTGSVMAMPVGCYSAGGSHLHFASLLGAQSGSPARVSFGVCFWLTEILGNSLRWIRKTHEKVMLNKSL